MCFVVFMHAASGPLHSHAVDPGENWYILNAVTSLAFCAVPLFFMMSGYLLFTSSKTQDISYLLKKRLPRLLFPLIVYSFFSSVWLSHISAEGFHVLGALNIFAQGASSPVMIHFWFMYTLIAVYLVSPFLYKAFSNLSSNGKRYLFWFLVVAMALGTLTTILPQSARVYLPYRFFSETLFFDSYICPLALGWLLGNMERKISNKVLIAVATVDWIIITGMTIKLTLENGAYTSTFQTQNRGFELILAVCIFLLFKQNFNRPLGKLNRWLTPVASLTFPIYLIHNLIISIFCALGFPCLNAPQVLCLTLAVLIVSYLLTKTAASIKPLCYLFTGLSYAEACRTCNWNYTFRRHPTLPEQ